MGPIIRRLKQLRVPSFDRGDHAAEPEGSVENPDALAARGGKEGGPSSAVPTHGAPPGYVKPDDGRPRH
jgi:hypothetical protein